MADEEEKQPIIVKKIKKSADGHHGGAWKVAYADFVTAMMAFFLLMWLINATTQEQKTAISSYFDPTAAIVSDSVSGAGGLLMGQAVTAEGAMVSNMQELVNTPEQLRNVEVPIDRGTGGQDEIAVDQEALEEERREQERFDQVEEELRQAIQETPELQELAQNLMIDQTPEGLRIQIVDQEGQAMFPSGSARMFRRMETLLTRLSGIIAKQPNKVSIRGHTDSVPFRRRDGYGNWELSTDRAHASRDVLVSGELPEQRVYDVVGKADRDPLLPEDPENARNRRISVILLKDSVVRQREQMSRASTTPRSLAPPRRSNSIIEFD